MLKQFENSRAMSAGYCAAWNAHAPMVVAAHFTDDARMQVNKGDLILGRDAIAQVAAGFFDDFPDLQFQMTDLRSGGARTLFKWSWVGTSRQTGNRCRLAGWDEWLLTSDHLIEQAHCWFDTKDIVRQIAGKARIS